MDKFSQRSYYGQIQPEDDVIITSSKCPKIGPLDRKVLMVTIIGKGLPTSRVSDAILGSLLKTWARQCGITRSFYLDDSRSRA